MKRGRSQSEMEQGGAIFVKSLKTFIMSAHEKIRNPHATGNL
jgi:hypothetical protein